MCLNVDTYKHVFIVKCTYIHIAFTKCEFFSLWWSAYCSEPKWRKVHSIYWHTNTTKSWPHDNVCVSGVFNVTWLVRSIVRNHDNNLFLMALLPVQCNTIHVLYFIFFSLPLFLPVFLTVFTFYDFVSLSWRENPYIPQPLHTSLIKSVWNGLLKP